MPRSYPSTHLLMITMSLIACLGYILPALFFSMGISVCSGLLIMVCWHGVRDSELAQRGRDWSIDCFDINFQRPVVCHY